MFNKIRTIFIKFVVLGLYFHLKGQKNWWNQYYRFLKLYIKMSINNLASFFPHFRSCCAAPMGTNGYWNAFSQLSAKSYLLCLKREYATAKDTKMGIQDEEDPCYIIQYSSLYNKIRLHFNTLLFLDYKLPSLFPTFIVCNMAMPVFKDTFFRKSK